MADVHWPRRSTGVPWSIDEERRLLRAFVRYGPKWTEVADKLPGRTALQAKSFWYGKLRAKTTRRPSVLSAYLRILALHPDGPDSAAARVQAYEELKKQHAAARRTTPQEHAGDGSGNEDERDAAVAGAEQPSAGQAPEAAAMAGGSQQQPGGTWQPPAPQPASVEPADLGNGEGAWAEGRVGEAWDESGARDTAEPLSALFQPGGSEEEGGSAEGHGAGQSGTAGRSSSSGANARGAAAVSSSSGSVDVAAAGSSGGGLSHRLAAGTSGHQGLPMCWPLPAQLAPLPRAVGWVHGSRGGPDDSAASSPMAPGANTLLTPYTPYQYLPPPPPPPPTSAPAAAGWAQQGQPFSRPFLDTPQQHHQVRFCAGHSPPPQQQPWAEQPQWQQQQQQQQPQRPWQEQPEPQQQQWPRTQLQPSWLLEGPCQESPRFCSSPVPPAPPLAVARPALSGPGGYGGQCVLERPTSAPELRPRAPPPRSASVSGLTAGSMGLQRWASTLAASRAAAGTVAVGACRFEVDADAALWNASYEPVIPPAALSGVRTLGPPPDWDQLNAPPGLAGQTQRVPAWGPDGSLSAQQRPFSTSPGYAPQPWRLPSADDAERGPLSASAAVSAGAEPRLQMAQGWGPASGEPSGHVRVGGC